jgi:hypothetical protein
MKIESRDSNEAAIAQERQGENMEWIFPQHLQVEPTSPTNWVFWPPELGENKILSINHLVHDGGSRKPIYSQNCFPNSIYKILLFMISSSQKPHHNQPITTSHDDGLTTLTSWLSCPVESLPPLIGLTCVAIKYCRVTMCGCQD